MASSPSLKSVKGILMYQNASTLDPNNSAVSSDIKLDIPMYQIIGSKDEIWETNIDEYRNNFTNLKQFIVKDANHKDVLLQAGIFYEGLNSIYERRK